MARRQTAKSTRVDDFRYDATRKNNPPIGLASYEPSLQEPETREYAYDPHLSPQLIWAGKPGLRSIEVEDAAGVEVETVSLHVHERVSSRAIIDAVRRPEPKQLGLFADPQLPLTEAVEFYEHDVDWTNRLILGDSLYVMNSLAERESLAGKVQRIYVDPPYGVDYKSNFQPRINQRDVKEDDASLSREPEMIKAYRDTWTLGVHSYLTYLRDRLRVARELLTDSGSIFVQISDDNVHRVRALLDEVFGAENIIGQVVFQKTGGFGQTAFPSIADFLLWYAKSADHVKVRRLLKPLDDPPANDPNYASLEFPDGTTRRMTREERRRETSLPSDARVFQYGPLTSDGRSNSPQDFKFEGRPYRPGPNQHWKTSLQGMERLARAGYILRSGENNVRFKLYWDSFAAQRLSNVWLDTQSGGFNDPKIYVVQTTNKVIERCLLMTTDAGDLVLDPTCGSGTSAYVAEEWGRRWITIDTSRVALSLARQRLMTATFPYYQLADREAGVDGGFVYKTVPHITLKSIAQNTRIDPVAERYQQQVDALLAGGQILTRRMCARCGWRRSAKSTPSSPRTPSRRRSTTSRTRSAASFVFPAHSRSRPSRPPSSRSRLSHRLAGSRNRITRLMAS
ncbi:MAG TPA: site-specific DNA-methyltransferase [Thermomicrobiales bacterium]|nr:site-specific DNA-methyltransferase [Thermomicrobiales bacterium]